MPFAGAQLALDGRSYVAPLSREAANRSLGPCTPFGTTTDARARLGAPDELRAGERRVQCPNCGRIHSTWWVEAKWYCAGLGDAHNCGTDLRRVPHMTEREAMEHELLQRLRRQLRVDVEATEQTGALQYCSTATASDCSDTPPLDTVAESAFGPFSRRRSQLELPLDSWDSPQLTMFARLDVAHNLLDGRTDSNRDAKCLRTRFEKDTDVKLDRFSSGKYAVRGLIRCDRMTCPHCGTLHAHDVACRIGACIKAHATDADRDHDVWMLSLSPPHYADEMGRSVVARLYSASRFFFRSRAWRDFAARFDIVARVRVLDATHGGKNGTHPHFHVALFPRAARVPEGWTASPALLADARKRLAGSESFHDAWVARIIKAGVASGTPEGMRAAVAMAAWRLVPTSFVASEPLRSFDRAERTVFLDEVSRRDLLDAWEHACVRAGIEIADRYAFRRYALQLTPSEDAAAYFVKWGLADEVGASTKKARSHLRLLDLVAAGYDRAGDIYREFRESVHGRAWVSGLTDACRVLNVDDAAARAYLDELQRRREIAMAEAGTPVVKVRELQLVIPSAVFPAALRAKHGTRSGLDAVTAFVDELDATGVDVAELQRELSTFLWRHLPRQGPPPPKESS